MEDKKVQILLSSYNGEKYVSEQIDSLLAQSYQNIHILIRDDGSKDKTIEILKKYESNFPTKISVNYGKNIGVIKSFFELIKISENDYEFYFFCDQDDFWEKDKIKRAVEIMQSSKEISVGYCSNLKLVDEKLNFMRLAYTKLLIPNLLNSFYENIVTGCSYSCNNSLFLKIKDKTKVIDSKKIPMHDHYFYFLTCLYGKLIYDDRSYILYRQHSSNVVGLKKKNIYKRAKNVFFNSKRINRKIFLEEIYKKHLQDMNEKDGLYLRQLVENYNCLFKRIITIFKLKFIRQNKMDCIFTKICYLLKRL